MVCNHPLNCQNPVVLEGRWLPIPRSEASPHLQGSPLVTYKWNPNCHGKGMVSTNPVFFFISCKDLFAQIVWTDTEFQFIAITVMSMAAKSSELDKLTSGANLQTEGHTPIPSRGWENPEETGPSGNAPSCSPSWSPVLKPLPSCPDTQHCLGTHVTLTEEMGAAPPPSHTWMAPVVEDMLFHSRAGLTTAVVTGTGWAVLFYGRQSLGQGLSLGEVRDTMFALTGAGTWVGKFAYLATDPLTKQEGQRAVTQAITECWIETKGPGQPCSQLLTPQPFRFHHSGDSP